MGMRKNRLRNGSDHLNKINQITSRYAPEDLSGAMLNHNPGRALTAIDAAAFLEMLYIIAGSFPDGVPLQSLAVQMDGGDTIRSVVDARTDVYRFYKNDILVTRSHATGIMIRRKGLAVEAHRNSDWTDEEIDLLIEANWTPSAKGRIEYATFYPPATMIDTIIPDIWNGVYLGPGYPGR
jgi:hypothetical protein